MESESALACGVLGTAAAALQFRRALSPGPFGACVCTPPLSPVQGASPARRADQARPFRPGDRDKRALLSNSLLQQAYQGAFGFSQWTGTAHVSGALARSVAKAV